MPDIFDSVKRSEIMRRVPSSGSRPELKVQAALDAAGIRYLHHPVDVPGKPDFLISSAKTAAYMHGCFWHGHSCKRGARLPKTNQDYWQAKIARNVERDESNRMKLEGDGWQVIVIWECDLEEGTTTLLKTLANALQPVTNFGTTHKQDEGLETQTESNRVARGLDNQRFRAILEERGMSQAALAKEMGVSRRAVKSWAQDRTPIPELLDRLAGVLGIEQKDLLREE